MFGVAVFVKTPWEYGAREVKMEKWHGRVIDGLTVLTLMQDEPFSIREFSTGIWAFSSASLLKPSMLTTIVLSIADLVSSEIFIKQSL